MANQRFEAEADSFRIRGGSACLLCLTEEFVVDMERLLHADIYITRKITSVTT